MLSNQDLIARNLTIFRGEKCIFKHLSLELSAGKLCLIKGANGSGKSTFLACLAGMTKPDLGEVENRPPFHWVGHKNGIKQRETPRQHIQTWGKALGADYRAEREAISSWGVLEVADLPSKHLSQGQKRRTALARLALVERPLWLLDEPFSGLDADGKDKLRQAISQHLKANGLAVLALHEQFDLTPDIEIAL